MKFEYRPAGVCSRCIYLDVEGGIVKDVVEKQFNRRHLWQIFCLKNL